VSTRALSKPDDRESSPQPQKKIPETTAGVELTNKEKN
jgi:hypothetical protein